MGLKKPGMVLKKEKEKKTFGKGQKGKQKNKPPLNKPPQLNFSPSQEITSNHKIPVGAPPLGKKNFEILKKLKIQKPGKFPPVSFFFLRLKLENPQEQ